MNKCINLIMHLINATTIEQIKDYNQRQNHSKTSQVFLFIKLEEPTKKHPFTKENS